MKLKKSCHSQLFLLIFILSSNYAFASFPVERRKSSEVTVSTVSIGKEKTTNEITSQAIVAYDKWVAVAFWFFLSWPFAAHRWYAGKPAGWNILFIITIGGLGIWASIDLINILTDNLEIICA